MSGRLMCLAVAAGCVAGMLSAGRTSRHALRLSAQPVDGLARELDQRFTSDVRPLVQKYCVGCHEGNDPPGDLALDRAASVEPFLHGDFNLHLMREMISTGEMPPKKKPQPTEHERLILTQWLDALLAYVPLDAPVDPGWCTPHRLNRAEYQNTIRDLLHLEDRAAQVADKLPRDDTGYGFDNIADVLAISPIAVEQYLAVAEAAIDLALGPIVELGDHPQLVRPLKGSNGQPLGQGGFYLYSNGAAAGQFIAPLEGEYLIRVRSWETHAGDEPAKLSLRIDGKEVGKWSISAKQDEPQEDSVRVRLKAGKRAVAAHFLNDFYQPGVADRNLGVEAVSISGPLDAQTTTYPRARKEIMGAAGDEHDETQAARRILAAFASRAYRRPASDQQIDGLLGVYRAERARQATHESSIRTALTAALVSPSFLFRTVTAQSAVNAEKSQRTTLDGYELASRLSYFLWSSMPDAALLHAAADGSLLTDAELSKQVARMLADARSHAFIENFSGQWLQLRTLETLSIDTARFPDFTPELRKDMIREATLFFQDVLRSDRSVLDLIDSDDVIVNSRLAKLYGLPDMQPGGFQTVKLDPDSPRGGILTMGAILTLTSNTTRTSPVKRGLFVLDQMLGAPPPPPPADIPPLEQSAHARPDATVREQLALHTANASCAACHNRLDPLGLTFENFDAIGRFRTSESGRPIDSSGTLPGGTVLRDTQDLKKNLLSRADQFVEALTGKVLTYGLGRGLEPFDRPAVRKIALACRERGDRLSALIEAVVLSESFRTCRARAAAGAQQSDGATTGDKQESER